MIDKTYIESYKIWDIYFCEARGRFYAYDIFGGPAITSNEFESELKRYLDKLWETTAL